MGLRRMLVVLIVAATAVFVAGTITERAESQERHETTDLHTSSSHIEPLSEAGEHADEGREASQGELRPGGVDVEAWPFVAPAALASLALAIAILARTPTFAVLAATTVAMLAFAVLDIGEVAHQYHEGNDTLLALSAAVAVLHLAAAGVAAHLAARARPHRPMAGPAGTMPA